MREPLDPIEAVARIESGEEVLVSLGELLKLFSLPFEYVRGALVSGEVKTYLENGRSKNEPVSLNAVLVDAGGFAKWLDRQPNWLSHKTH